MIVKVDTDLIKEKMQELCTELLQQESYQTMRNSIDRFAEDERSVEQYDSFMAKHRALEQMETRNEEPTDDEMNEYEQAEQALYENEVIRKFLYAQREFNQLHDLVSQYFRLTVQLNRLPESSELPKGGCGCGGSCGGHGH
ncbi:YlbF family regulator [Cohnella fermenti]|uniref:YlbF family regulator n=1 Tax=Cohnella fermenti TaxID=2565925 RepID=A0A4S4BML7_9BACL|nr:YlbF family regulator [Cohnella fermenti]THF76074.1 YlbF family regulator [Cohnella fermenti]